MSDQTTKKSHGFTTVMTIIVIIFATAFWYFVLYGPLPNENLTSQSKSNQFSLVSKNFVNISEFNIDINADVGNFNIQSLPNDSNYAFNAEWVFDYRYDASIGDHLEINIMNSTINNTLNIEIEVIYPSGEPVLITFSNFTIFLNPNYSSYGLNANLTAGSMNVALKELNFNTFSIATLAGSIDLDIEKLNIYNDFNLHSSAGSLDLNLADTFIQGNFETQTNAGSIYLDISNIFFDNSTNVSINSDAGSIGINWIQEEVVGGDIMAYIHTSAGNIDMNIDNKINPMKYQVALNSNIGSEDFNFENEWNSENDYLISPEFNTSTAFLLQLNLNTAVGSIELDIAL